MNHSKRAILLALGKLVKKHGIEVGIWQQELGFHANLARTDISGIEQRTENPRVTGRLPV